MSEYGDVDSGTEQVEDKRTLAEKVMEGELKIAISAVAEVANLIASADLPWSDVKLIMVGNRAETVLSDLDHMVLRMREQPSEPEVRALDERPPGAVHE